MDRAHILELPVELIQHIASQCKPADLSTLRLVCKDLDAAIFDVFAEEYLVIQACFLLNPARLSRLRKLLDSPRLAAQLKKVVLTLDPLEFKPGTWTRLDGGYEDPFIHDQYNKYSEAPDQQVLSSICKNLAAIDLVEFDLRCDCCQRDGTKMEDNKPAIMSSILRAGLNARPYALEMENMEFQSEDLTNALVTWADCLEDVTIHNALPIDVYEKYWPELLRLLAKCSKLDALYLRNLDHCYEAEDYCSAQFFEDAPGYGWTASTDPEARTREGVVAFLNKNIEEGMPVCEDSETLAQANRVRQRLKLPPWHLWQPEGGWSDLNDD